MDKSEIPTTRDSYGERCINGVAAIAFSGGVECILVCSTLAELRQAWEERTHGVALDVRRIERVRVYPYRLEK